MEAFRKEAENKQTANKCLHVRMQTKLQYWYVSLYLIWGIFLEKNTCCWQKFYPHKRFQIWLKLVFTFLSSSKQSLGSLSLGTPAGLQPQSHSSHQPAAAGTRRSMFGISIFKGRSKWPCLCQVSGVTAWCVSQMWSSSTYREFTIRRETFYVAW